MFYSHADLSLARRQYMWRLAAMCVIALLPNAGAAAIMYTTRVEALSMLLSAMGLAGAIFFYGLCVAPFAAYKRFLREVLEGRTRGFTGTLLRQESDSLRDGVRCHTYYFLDDASGEERLCYLDAEKPFAFQTQTRYTLTMHGQAIVQAEPI